MPVDSLVCRRPEASSTTQYTTGQVCRIRWSVVAQLTRPCFWLKASPVTANLVFALWLLSDQLHAIRPGTLSITRLDSVQNTLEHMS